MTEKWPENQEKPSAKLPKGVRGSSEKKGLEVMVSRSGFFREQVTWWEIISQLQIHSDMNNINI